jgi:hypothetical protein
MARNKKPRGLKKFEADNDVPGIGIEKCVTGIAKPLFLGN